MWLSLLTKREVKMALFFRVFTGGGGVKAYENEGENKTNKQKKDEAANIQPTSEQAWSIQQIGIQELIDSESIRCCFVQWIFDWTSVKHIKHFE